MVVVPVEAALANDRRIVAWAAGAAGLGLAVLAAAPAFAQTQAADLLPLSPMLLSLIGAASAMSYAAALAVMVQLVQRRSQSAVRAGEDRYRLLAENATDMITRHDEKGRVLFASFAAQQLFGEPAQKIAGDGLFERVHVADRPAYLTALSRSFAEQRVDRRRVQGPPRECERSPRAMCGSRCAAGRCAPRMTAVDRPGIVAVTRDISDRKAQEAELLRTRDEAESASRAKTQFLANMSHELRTPLNAVIGFSEILNRELFGAIGEARYRDYARLIHESGEHLLNVVNDILDMSKIEAGKFKIVKEPFDVAPLVKSCCDLMRHTAEQRSLVAHRGCGARHPGASGRQARLQADAAQSDLERHQVHRFRRLGARLGAPRPARHVEFSVADNGIGIAEADLPKLGNPFVQANNSYDRSYDGAGLGLSVVKGLARLHGGRLELAEQRWERARSPRSSCRSIGAGESVEAPLQSTPAVSAA